MKDRYLRRPCLGGITSRPGRFSINLGGSAHRAGWRTGSWAGTTAATIGRPGRPSSNAVRSTLAAGRREGILAPDVQRFGTWVWSDPDSGEHRASIGYEVETTAEGSGTVRLSYTMTRTQERVEYRIGLQTTRPRLGGLRWWFTCPLVVGGRPCRRRCGKLYLPPSGRYYGCRMCYGLTYTSCRESYRWDSLWRLMGAEAGIDARTMRRVMERQAREDRRFREEFMTASRRSGKASRSGSS